MLFARFDRRAISELLETPSGVVPRYECGDGGAHLLEVLEDSAVGRLFLERAVLPLGHAICFQSGVDCATPKHTHNSPVVVATTVPYGPPVDLMVRRNQATMMPILNTLPAGHILLHGRC